MKVSQFLPILLLWFVTTSLVANGNTTNVSLHNQLKTINQFWNIESNYSTISAETLGSELTFQSREAIIQTHLQLVEQALRSKPTDQLNISQQFNRTQGLDILNNYWQMGVFPKNTNHSYAIPYFIDNYNTACAVGHIMRESGSEAMANMVASTNNNAYIAEMPNQTEITNWADKMGFTVEEFKWIQPTYGPPLYFITTTNQPSCGLNDGSITAIPFSENEGMSVNPDSLYYVWDNGVEGLELNDIEAGKYCISAYYNEDLTGLIHKTCFWLSNDVTNDYYIQVQNETCGNSEDGAIGVLTGSDANLQINWYDYLGDLIATGDTINGLDGLSIDYVNFGYYPINEYTTEIISEDGCVAYQTNYVFEDEGAMLYYEVLQEAACGSANGVAAIFIEEGEILTALWNDGFEGVERNDLAVGSYYVTVTDNYGCETIIYVEMFEECPQPINCESDLTWAIELAESSSCVCRVEEYFSLSLGMPVILVDSDCNYIDDPDAYYDCYGNWLCSTNGEIPDDDWCGIDFTNDLEYIQNIYSCYPTNCDDGWLESFWNNADHIYCGATQVSDFNGITFYELSGINANGEHVYDYFDCVGSLICQANSNEPEDLVCYELIPTLDPILTIYDDCNISNNIIVANDDYVLNEDGDSIITINVLENDIYPFVGNAALENTTWHLTGMFGGIAGAEIEIPIQLSMVLAEGIADFQTKELTYAIDEEQSIITFDSTGWEEIGGALQTSNVFYYTIEGNQLYLYDTTIADGYNLVFTSYPDISLAVVAEPSFGIATVNDDFTITYTANTDTISEDYFTYQICTNIAGAPYPECGSANVFVTGLPNMGACDYIELCNFNLCTHPNTPLEICFEQCEGIANPETAEYTINSLFTSTFIIHENGCITYFALPGLIGIDEVHIQVMGGDNCFESFLSIDINENCGDVSCNLQSTISTNSMSFGGTEDILQSSWWADVCFIDAYNFGLDNITNYDWQLSTGETSDAEQFCASIPVRENAENLDVLHELCLTVTSADGCTATTCIEFKNPLTTDAVDDYFFAEQNETTNVSVYGNDTWQEQIPINTGQDEAIFSIIQEPEYGTATIVGDPACFGLFCDQIAYEPYLGFEGLDEMIYQLCVNDWCDTAIVFFEVGTEVPASVIEGNVWPGDANADGTANNFDVLALGLAFYAEGLERPDASINWEPQFSPNWGQVTSVISIANFNDNDSTYESYLVDTKHADCDGNGTVGEDDIIAIETNYGMSYGKGIDLDIEVPSGNPILAIEVQGDTLLAGSTVTADIVLKMPDGSPVNNVYGVAFTIDYENYTTDDVPLIIEGSMQVNLNDSWLGNQFNSIKIAKDHSGAQNLDIGYTRIDHQQLSGNGKIASVSFIIEENIAGKTATFLPLNLNIKNAFIGNADGVLLPTNTENETIEVTTSIGGVPPYIDNAIKVFPNPTNNSLNVDLGSIQLQQITVIDLTGRTVFNSNNYNASNATINTERFANGFYLIQIETTEGYLITRKVEVLH